MAIFKPHTAVKSDSALIQLSRWRARAVTSDSRAIRFGEIVFSWFWQSGSWPSVSFSSLKSSGQIDFAKSMVQVEEGFSLSQKGGRLASRDDIPVKPGKGPQSSISWSTHTVPVGRSLLHVAFLITALSTWLLYFNECLLRVSNRSRPNQYISVVAVKLRYIMLSLTFYLVFVNTLFISGFYSYCGISCFVQLFKLLWTFIPRFLYPSLWTSFSSMLIAFVAFFPAIFSVALPLSFHLYISITHKRFVHSSVLAASTFSMFGFLNSEC